MLDIYVGIAVIGVLSLAALLASLHVAKRASRPAVLIACGMIVAFLIAHKYFVSDQLWVARVLPFSNVMVLGNPLPIAVATLAGFAWHHIPGRAVRKIALLLPLIALCAYRSIAPLTFPMPAMLDERWRDGVCLQTSLSTCSAAAAATLLREHGIGATESEMASLCLTSEKGTTSLGLYRGLAIKTAGTSWKVETFHADTPRLRSMSGPMILPVRFDRRPGIDPRYARDWGWLPGVSHHIVFFKFSQDGEKCEMGDPSVGRENWSARDIGVLWHGDGIRLVKR